MIEKYNNLIKACGEDTEMVEFIAGRVKKCLDYVNSVIIEAIDVPRFRLQYSDEPKLLQYEIMELDKMRRECHESAILACKRLNIISEQFGLPPFYPGDINDRYQVADFCIEVVRTFYDSNKSQNKDLSNDEFVLNQHSKIPNRRLEWNEEER